MKKSKKIFKSNNGEKYYKLYDDRGNEIGRINPLFEKKQSNWLKGVSIFLLTDDGKLVLEKRSKNTNLTPNDMDLVSGHRDEEEKGKKAAYRELKEELGIKPKKVLALKKVKHETPMVFKGGRNFFISFYVTKLKKKIDYLDFQEAEVEDVMMVPLQEGFNLIRENKTKFPYTGNEKKFEEIFEKVELFYQKSIKAKETKTHKKFNEKNKGESR